MQMKTFEFHRGLFSFTFFLLLLCLLTFPGQSLLSQTQTKTAAVKTTMWESTHQSVRVCVCLQDKDNLRKKEKMWNLVPTNFAAGRHKLTGLLLLIASFCLEIKHLKLQVWFCFDVIAIVLLFQREFICLFKMCSVYKKFSFCNRPTKLDYQMAGTVACNFFLQFCGLFTSLFVLFATTQFCSVWCVSEDCLSIGPKKNFQFSW